MNRITMQFLDICDTYMGPSGNFVDPIPSSLFLPRQQVSSLSAKEPKARIKIPISDLLISKGFEEVDDMTWIRKRHPVMYDYIHFPLYWKFSPDVIGVGMHVGIHCPAIEKLLLLVFSKKTYTKLFPYQYFPLFAPLLSNVYPDNKTLRSRWNFYGANFSQHTIAHLLAYLEFYALPFVESFNNDNLKTKIDFDSNLKPSLLNLAALCLISGELDKAKDCLKNDTHNYSNEYQEMVAKLIEFIESEEINILLTQVKEEFQVAIFAV